MGSYLSSEVQHSAENKKDESKEVKDIDSNELMKRNLRTEIHKLDLIEELKMNPNFNRRRHSD